MPLPQLPALLCAWLTDITAALDCRRAPCLLLLFVGALLAKGRRTVTSWFRAVGIDTDFRCTDSTLWADGRRADALSYDAKKVTERTGMGESVNHWYTDLLQSLNRLVHG